MTLRIRYVKSGGFAGLIRGCTIDASSLAPTAAAVMKGLAKAALASGVKVAKAKTPGMADVPILAMSSGPAANEQLRCHDAGLAGPVAKPVTPDTLGPHILRCLRRR